MSRSGSGRHAATPDVPSAGVAGRILCVTSNFPRWDGDTVSPFVLHLAQDLQALGWQVDVLAPHAPGAARTEVLAGVATERFRYAWPESLQTVCYGGGAMVNLRKRPSERLKIPGLVGAELAAIHRRLVTRRYDVLHSHWILPQGFAGMLASRFAGVPHVVTVHGGDVSCLGGRIMCALKRMALTSADTVTVNSHFTERVVRDLAPGLATVRRIPMGVQVESPSAESRVLSRRLRERHRPGEGPLLISVGRIVEEKGIADAIRALDILRRDHPDVTLLVVGEGQDRPAMEALARDLGVGGQVRFLGWMEPPQVRAHLAAADIFIGASRTGPDGWVEAQGLALLEAMAADTPVVATRLGGVVESVCDGETGLLVDETSPAQIAQAVRRLTANPDLGRRLAGAAARLVRERFSREASARAFSALLSGQLPHRKPAVPGSEASV